MVLTLPWRKKTAEWESWYLNQMQAFAAGASIEPPWIAFPKSEPWSFKQGVNEAWLINVFLPYWKRQDAGARHDYLLRWPPPDDSWREYLTEKWI